MLKKSHKSCIYHRKIYDFAQRIVEVRFFQATLVILVSLAYLHISCIPYVTTAVSQHETLIRCWFDAGPASATLDQHQTSAGSRACRERLSSDSPPRHHGDVGRTGDTASRNSFILVVNHVLAASSCPQGGPEMSPLKQSRSWRLSPRIQRWFIVVTTSRMLARHWASTGLLIIAWTLGIRQRWWLSCREDDTQM